MPTQNQVTREITFLITALQATRPPRGALAVEDKRALVAEVSTSSMTLDEVAVDMAGIKETTSLLTPRPEARTVPEYVLMYL
jgi:hypothetical protein